MQRGIEIPKELINDIKKRVKQFVFKNLDVMIELIILLYERGKKYYE